MLDITTLAAWGEFIGGIAVVVSLIYLAGQIRQNSRLLTYSAASAVGSWNTQLNDHLVQDQELARIFWQGMADREALSEPDRMRFDPLIQILVSGYQERWQLAQNGVLSGEAWEDVQIGQRWTSLQPGYRGWWKEWGGRAYGGEFKRHVDGLIREGEAAE